MEPSLESRCVRTANSRRDVSAPVSISCACQTVTVMRTFFLLVARDTLSPSADLRKFTFHRLTRLDMFAPATSILFFLSCLSFLVKNQTTFPSFSYFDPNSLILWKVSMLFQDCFSSSICWDIRDNDLLHLKVIHLIQLSLTFQVMKPGRLTSVCYYSSIPKYGKQPNHGRLWESRRQVNCFQMLNFVLCS